MDERVLASQKHVDGLWAFWPRKVSQHITGILIRTAVSANHATILWGVISVMNSYTVYLALTGNYAAILAVPVVYFFCMVLDCVDGELARFNNLVNPFGGKLLDGICHRATEFSLLAAYTAAAYTRIDSPMVLAIGLLLLTADGMYVYVYERRLMMLRLQIGFKGHVKLTSATVYQRGTRWGALTRKQQAGTITGLFNYKSAYAVIALSFLPTAGFLAGLGAIAAFKHVKWIRLAHRALGEGAKFGASKATAAAATAATATAATPVGPSSPA